MTGRRSDDDGVTIGEVYRLVEALKDDHGQKLESIDQQVRITNGRTTRLEGKMDILWGLKDAAASTPPSLPVVTPEGESLSIKISKKMFALIVSVVTGLLVFVPILARWIEGFIK
jgi:hypothetical protein